MLAARPGFPETPNGGLTIFSIQYSNVIWLFSSKTTQVRLLGSRYIDLLPAAKCSAIPPSSLRIIHIRAIMMFNDSFIRLGSPPDAGPRIAQDCE